MRQRGMGHEHQPEQVGVDHANPFARVRGLDRTEQHHTRVVDEDVQAAELVHRALHRSSAGISVCDVKVYSDGARPTVGQPPY